MNAKNQTDDAVTFQKTGTKKQEFGFGNAQIQIRAAPTLPDFSDKARVRHEF